MFNIKAIIFVAVLFIGGITVANAQINQGAVLKVDVPNAFVLDGHNFAAGQYTIERTPSTIDSPSLLIIRDVKGGNAMIFDTIAARSDQAARSTQLVFDNVGGTYFLSQIWIKGATTANEVPMSKSERRMIAATPASKVTVPTTVTGF
jgi:hypothetical protein